MRRTGLAGLPRYRRCGRRTTPGVTITNLVKRNFTRSRPNQSWVTDITEHLTRGAKGFCCIVSDAFYRRVVGWAVDSHAEADLATNALSIVISTKEPNAGAVKHADHGPQFTSWAFNRHA